MVIGIVMARKGSKGKNLWDAGGKPLVYWAARALKQARSVDVVAVSTDDEDIKEAAASGGARVFLSRPEDLCQDNSNLGEGIKWSVERLAEVVGTPELVAVTLGNVVFDTGRQIDEMVALLRSRPDADSVMPVWKADHHFPHYAYKINAGGFVEPVYPRPPVGSNRGEQPPAYYHNERVRVFRPRTLVIEGNPLYPGPCWWSGSKCLPYVHALDDSLDVHSEFDRAYSDWWLKTYGGAE